MGRIILLDYSVFMFAAIFACSRNKDNKIPPTYTSMAMMISCLKELNATLDDTIIIAIDSRSWRKDVDPQYKANRKEKREESDIDWEHWFKEYGKLRENIAQNTPFHVVQVEKMECDDLIAVATRYYSDRECIIVSTDSDFEQLCCQPNVKCFSSKSKKFKEVKNPYKLLAKKIEQERTDNLLSPVLTEADYNKRKMLVDLTSLPQWVEDTCKSAIDKIEKSCYNKTFDWDRLWFKKSLQPRLKALFYPVIEEKEQMELL